MTEILSSASFPAGFATARDEQHVRELVRVKLRAQAAWDAFCKLNRAGLSEDEQIDREIESKRLCRALNDADSALYRAMT